MNPIVFHDPIEKQHQYLTQMFFNPLGKFLRENKGLPEQSDNDLTKINNAIVLTSADHLNAESIGILKNNGCKIIGFSVTDSSYVAQSCREGEVLQNVDLMFMLTGIQLKNYGYEIGFNKDLALELKLQQFLPEKDWKVFHSMHKKGRIKSLPYVHWQAQPKPEPQPYKDRSQKVLVRGGHHMRRFLLCLQLLHEDLNLLDVNSGFYTAPYYRDDMNPQFRYCDSCRAIHKAKGMLPAGTGLSPDCTNPHAAALNLERLGEWNNKCPASFYHVAGFLKAPKEAVETLLNAQWIKQEDHLAMLSRITFTSDLKWLFSIYAAQRFWDAAMSKCINVLPVRTNDQEFFPPMYENAHYLAYDELMSVETMKWDFHTTAEEYDHITSNALAQYNTWMKPTEFSINTNLLHHIFDNIERVTK